MKLRINKSGFTVIELLVVIALTVVIMALVFGPIGQSFNLTRRADVMIQAQESARNAMAQIRKDFSDAVMVYDNTRPEDKITLWVRDQSGLGVPVLVQYAKVDLLMPRMRAYCTAPADQHGDAKREFELDGEAEQTCPIDGTKMEFRPVQPIAPGKKVVRYFIGLLDPTKLTDGKSGNKVPDYSNQYLRIGSGKNMYVLYRAEFSPYDEIDPETGKAKNRLFPVGRSVYQNLTDSEFFYNQNSNNYSSSKSETYAQAWRAVSRVMVTSANSDLIRVKFDSQGRAIVTPTVSFSPAAVYNDPLVPTTDSESKPEHGAIPPTVYKAKYGQWIGNYEITVRRDTGSAVKVYKTLPTEETVNGNTVTNMEIWDVSQSNQTKAIFNITHYMDTASSPGSSNWKGYKYGCGEVVPAKPELAFTVDTGRGQVNFAFPHVDVDASEQLASILGGNTGISTIIPTKEVNRYYDEAEAQGALSERYRVWEFHHPKARTIPLTDYSIPEDRVLGNSTVVPGMERVIGPNQHYGDSYGRPMMYSRVPFWNALAEPALNQYKIDVDYPVRNPANADLLTGYDGTAAIYFNAQQTETGSGTRLPQDEDLAFYYTGQPSGTPPAGTISNVYLLYYEQNNKPGDTLVANYVTKSKITITLGVRVFDPSSRQPQLLQLSHEISLRNQGN